MTPFTDMPTPLSLMAATPTTAAQHSLAFLSTVVWGTAVAWWIVAVQNMVGRPSRSAIATWEFGQLRRSRLREASSLFRWCESLVDELKQYRWLQRCGRLESVRASLRLLGGQVPWTAEEYVAVSFLCGVLWATGSAFAFRAMFGTGMGIVLATGLGVAIFVMQPRQLRSRARRRVTQFKRRLPFAVDLLALMMEAGASFRDSLATVTKECRNHPVGEEFGRLQNQLDRGQTLDKALSEMQEQFRDDDVSEMVFAIQKAQELGTPLAQIFLTLADQMRLKRSQWAEKEAGKAQAMMSFPGLIIMLGCLLIVVAPFVLRAFAQSTA